ncbi:Non-specific phospholipase C1 [Linum perenne]
MEFRRHLPITAIFLLCLAVSSQSRDYQNLFNRHKHKINGPIKTIVVLVMENRSFDHMLGWLKSTRPDGSEPGSDERIRPAGEKHEGVATSGRISSPDSLRR